MRKIFHLLLIILIVLVSCHKDDEEIKPLEITPTYFTFSGEIGANDNSTIISNDSNLIICGNKNGNISVFKISKSGRGIWRNDVYAGNMSKALSVVQSPDGDLFICGSTYRNYVNTGKDILLIKTNDIGDTIWTKTYGSVDEDYGKNIMITSDGNLLIAGATYGSDPFGDIVLLKIKMNGDTIWTKRYADQDQEVPFSLIEISDGGYLITGTNEDNSNPRGLYLLKVNSNGEKIWDKTIGAGLWKWGYSTIELSNGDLLSCGQYTNHTNGFSQVLVLKTDDQGNIIWEKEYGENYLSERGNAIKQNADGTFTITGLSYDANTMRNDIIVLKIDQDGHQRWFTKFDSSKNGLGMNLIKDTNDDNIITGELNDSIFMAKTDTKGHFK